MSGDHDRYLQWPAHRFYFAVIDAPRGRRHHRWQEQALYAAEPQFPVPLEELHVSIATSPDHHTMVVCAAVRQELIQLPTTVLSLSPDAVPSCVAGQVSAKQFNLRTGPFEPPSARRLRRLARAITILAIGALGTLLATGFTRRTNTLLNAASAHSSAIRAVAQHVVEPTDNELNTQQLFLQLTSLLRTLRQTRTTSVTDPELFDASDTLATLLEHWPSDLWLRTDVLTVTRAQITIRADMRASEDVQKLADALAEIPGWQLAQPRVNATSEGVSCTMTLRPMEIAP